MPKPRRNNDRNLTLLMQRDKKVGDEEVSPHRPLFVDAREKVVVMKKVYANYYPEPSISYEHSP